MTKYKRTIGHKKIKEFFDNIIKSDNFASSYLFAGPQGIGKATFTFELLKIYFCVSENKPCEECKNCRRISHFNFPDIHPVLPDEIEKKYVDLIKEKDVSLENPRSSLFSKNLSIKIQQIRRLEQEVRIPSHLGKKKFYIFLDADLMKREAQNALLKTLEEPSKDTVFILISSRLHLLLPTIRSRSQIFTFFSLNFGEFSKYKFSSTVNIEHLHKASMGSIGKSLYLLSRDFTDLRKKLLQCIVSGKSITSLWRGKIQQEETSVLLQILQTFYLDLLLVKMGAKQNIINEDILPVYERYVNKMSFWQIEKLYLETINLEDALIRNVSPNLILLSLPKFSFTF